MFIGIKQTENRPCTHLNIVLDIDSTEISRTTKLQTPTDKLAQLQTTVYTLYQWLALSFVTNRIILLTISKMKQAHLVFQLHGTPLCVHCAYNLCSYLHVHSSMCSDYESMAPGPMLGPVAHF